MLNEEDRILKPERDFTNQINAFIANLQMEDCNAWYAMYPNTIYAVPTSAGLEEGYVV